MKAVKGTGKAKARKAANSSVVDTGARFGLVARGVLYLLIGLLALRVAFGGENQEADSSGAIRELAQQPFGKVLVWAVGIGLVGMALWRLSEALFGSAGPDGGKPGKRILSAGRFVFYGFMAYSVLSFAASARKSKGSDAKSQDFTARALDLPAGRWLVGIAGLVVIGIGIGVGVRAALRKYHKHLKKAQMSRHVRRAIDVLGVSGGVARGLIYGGAGVFVVIAAAQYDPDEAKGVDGTLRSFAGTPAGPWLLALVAFGLLLFGLFSFALARYRRV
ncbi:DUF1206 domain-containing protein [Streptomyces sp. NPDC049813]|uniref:DUF1206 domain-containing protein n=1 Tax=Streptomyces sp. NPDC049813 TaxID=3365597 RepID=UPI0037B8ABFD